MLLALRTWLRAAAAFALVACAKAPPAAPSPPPAVVDDRATPVSVTKAWIEAVRAADWTRLISLLPPAKQAKARGEAIRVPESQRASLQRTAERLSAALAQQSPAFVEVHAILAEPAHREWYFCGEKPQGEFWQSPCAVSVVEVEGRWYVMGVNDDLETRHDAP